MSSLDRGECTIGLLPFCPRLCVRWSRPSTSPRMEVDCRPFRVWIQKEITLVARGILLILKILVGDSGRQLRLDVVHVPEISRSRRTVARDKDGQPAA